MDDRERKRESRNFLLVILLLQFTVYATAFIGVPVARQVIGFAYLTFVPGFILIKLLGLGDLEGPETILFSVGLSVAYLMLIGLILNEILPLLGIMQPLSLLPLTIILNSGVLLSAVVAFLRSKSIDFHRLRIRQFPPILFLAALPILGVLGAISVNSYGNNTIVLLLLLTIAVLFVVVLIFEKKLPASTYLIAVPMMAISLLFQSSLISKYLTTFGSDVSSEFLIFRATNYNAHWRSDLAPVLSPVYGRLNSMLSISILPTIYSTLLDIDATLIWKILYPLLFALVPLGLYHLWQESIGKKYAFAAAFLLMSQMTFYTEMLGLARQIVAELFFVLLLLVILRKKMKLSSKMLCFMIFSAALVMSHYAIAEIMLFFISVSFVSLVIIKRPSKSITATMVIFFFVAMFSWYLYTSNSTTFDSFVTFGNYVYDNLGQFFNPASRGQTVLTGLGLEAPTSIWSTFSRGFAYITEIFIVLGFIGLVARRLNVRFGRTYFVLTAIAVGFLAALIVVPSLAETMNMTRFYHVLLFFLAPLCILGAEFLIKFIRRREKELEITILLVIVLVPYFLFQTGFVYEVTGSESWSLPLSGYRMDGYRLYVGFGYVDDFAVFGARWMHQNLDYQRTQVYADLSSVDTLIIYGSVNGSFITALSNVTSLPISGMVYLGPLNTRDGKIVTPYYVCPSSGLTFLNYTNKIYTNGGSEIYGK